MVHEQLCLLWLKSFVGYYVYEVSEKRLLAWYLPTKAKFKAPLIMIFVKTVNVHMLGNHNCFNVFEPLKTAGQTKYNNTNYT